MWLTGLAAPRHVGSPQTRARTRVPCIGRQTLSHCATREAPVLLFNAGISSCPVQPTFFTSSSPSTSSGMPLLAFYPIFHFLLLILVPKDNACWPHPVCLALRLHPLCWCSVPLPCGRSQASLRLPSEDLRGSSKYNIPLFQKFQCLSL